MSSADRTRTTFDEKWKRNPDLAFRTTLEEGSEINRWILGRNGWADGVALEAYLADKRSILDAGCGNGRVTALLQRHAPAEAQLTAVDLTAAAVAGTNVGDLPNVTVRDADLVAGLDGLGPFDFVYCQEVLHHTSDPARAFGNLADVLAPGGELAIYVYRVKAPIREYTDDFVRNAISELPYEEAMEVSRQIAEVGRALSATGAKVTVPDVPVLGIEAGEYDVQRFVYHVFMKAFWNDELDAEANAVINYDWYHPQLSTRHTADEVRGWFADRDLEVVHEHIDPYGITMRGRRA